MTPPKFISEPPRVVVTAGFGRLDRTINPSITTRLLKTTSPPSSKHQLLEPQNTFPLPRWRRQLLPRQRLNNHQP
jgi:hypothetical protein